MPLGVTKKILLGLVVGIVCLMSLSLAGNAQSMMTKSNKLTGNQTAGHGNLRGTIESVAGKTLVIKTREGSKATITLADDLTVNTVTEASIDNIKEGDFVGIANVPDGGGTSSALEVVIFPAALKGTGEGDYAWDLKPNSSMTNATVANAVKGVNGRTVTVTYQGGQKKIAIPDNTPIVALAAGKVADLRAGAAVFIAAVNESDGKFTAHRVVVGTDGVVPPM
ncbi:hypothetical protein [Candidatus Phyllobacterium onerii]|uniref:hypothetical protein n=1 Tax=Candidatus Phyllobacterium onerii TaxID=3020828 RepID=UPI00233114C3|nr:hypothetical protein [Phyllobacterium sp. IY22]